MLPSQFADCREQIAIHNLRSAAAGRRNLRNLTQIAQDIASQCCFPEAFIVIIMAVLIVQTRNVFFFLVIVFSFMAGIALCLLFQDTYSIHIQTPCLEISIIINLSEIVQDIARQQFPEAALEVNLVIRQSYQSHQNLISLISLISLRIHWC